MLQKPFATQKSRDKRESGKSSRLKATMHLIPFSHTPGGGGIVKTTLENYLQLSNKAKHLAHSHTVNIPLMGILKRKKSVCSAKVCTLMVIAAKIVIA